MKKLEPLGVSAVVLESDEMRKILTPTPTYTPEERDAFYRALTLIGEKLTQSGVNVIFDATANKRTYRDQARALIPKFVEIYVQCPLALCMERDPKGIYGRASAGKTATVPGIQAPYEPPLNPELTVNGQAPPETESDAIINKLQRLSYL
jgi:adenylylsulfate kinase